MPYLTVVVFDDMEQAGEVRQSLKSIQKQGLLNLDDSAVVVKDEDGQVHVKNEVDRGIKVGLAGGGFIGLFVGFLFGGPIGAMLLGAIGGAAVGSMADLGIQKSFVKDVENAMKPGSSAIFFIIRDANPNAAISALKPYQGEVYHTALPTEAEETLRRVLRKKE
jgi:uncharacterized membrane protein